MTCKDGEFVKEIENNFSRLLIYFHTC